MARNRNQFLIVRISEAERDRIRERARDARQSVSAYVRTVAAYGAPTLIKEAA